MFGEDSLTRNRFVEVCEKAYAKVNLLLRVGPRQSDGFHPVVTVLQNLELYDDVRIAVTKREAGRDRVEVEADDPAIPRGLENLAGKAALLLLERAGVKDRCVSIRIKKRIPVAAGLAGGSSDAAAVLRGLDRALQLGLTGADLLSVAAELGSDVPACLAGGTLLGVGRGERVAHLRSMRFWWVLANPGVTLSTARVYAHFDAMGKGGGWEGEAHDRPLESLAPGLERCLEQGDVPGLATRLQNDLEEPARSLAQVISELIDRMKACGAKAALVSGSGPTVAGLAKDEDHARMIAGCLKGAAPWVWWGPSVPGPIWPVGPIPASRLEDGPLWLN